LEASLYTLQTGYVISKTKAGLWALDSGYCTEPDVLKKAVTIRNNPDKYINEPDTKKWLASFGPHIQKFADILEKMLKEYS